VEILAPRGMGVLMRQVWNLGKDKGGRGRGRGGCKGKVEEPQRGVE